MYCPGDQVAFVGTSWAAFLLAFAAVGDPAAFFRHFPFLLWIVPKNWADYVHKSIDYLEEGKRRRDSDAARAESDDSKDENIQSTQLLTEVRRRIRWWYVGPFILSGVGCKTVEYVRPRVVGRMMDQVVKEEATMETAFWPFFRILIMLVVLDYILTCCREYYRHAARHRYNADVKTEMIANVLNQELDFIYSEKRQFVHLVNLESQRLESLVNGMLPRLFFAMASLSGGCCALLQVDYRLALFGLCLKSPLLGMLQDCCRRDIIKYSKLYDASNGEANRLAASILDLGVIDMLQAHGAQRQMVNRYSAQQASFIDYLVYTHFRQTMLCLVGHGVRVAEDVLVLAVGLASVLDGSITIGEYMMFNAHLSFLDSGLKDLMNLHNELLIVKCTASAYFELLYRESKIPSDSKGKGKILDTSRGLSLTLHDVSFSYRTNPGVQVLNGVDMELAPGKVVAIVGSTGCGKSTLTRLMRRFYDPTQGSVRINGVDIRELDVSWLRDKIRVIDQDLAMPDLTILENIALGLGEFIGEKECKERVVAAAKQARIHDFVVNKCEKGYDTQLNHLSRLSGGERQRINIARWVALFGMSLV
ncbi:hypothetical protein THAOC_12091 [Thalassiosira oceanica]|uniref:ABC transmembrane type-1 domain-containing protein n=1 Tax=Thalassiosira oceanica TaxID=159749 RepID=K0T8S9_THAOC|nr:hypothetical protein THAOC_12091 [Thalassiosira oceanica]|eukprot:EJK66937.1 hypothetical protein THAOC_12091 [Thalassiosira oceanica]